jgi:hypothetical protein
MGKSNKVVISFDPPEVKERKSWLINPATKVIKSKKVKSRKRLNQEIPVILREEVLMKEEVEEKIE